MTDDFDPDTGTLTAKRCMYCGHIHTDVEKVEWQMDSRNDPDSLLFKCDVCETLAPEMEDVTICDICEQPVGADGHECEVLK